MDHDLIDARSSRNKNPEEIRWSLLPTMTFAGLGSAFLSVLICYPAISTGGKKLFVILASLLFGLTIGAVFWAYRLIQTWTMLSTIAAVTLAAHLLKLYSERHLPMQWQELVDIPGIANIAPAVAVKSFGVALILFIVFLLLTTPRTKIGWTTVAIALVCATFEAATVAAVDRTQRGAWIGFNIGDEFGFWSQPCLAFFLGVALVLNGLTTRLRARRTQL